MFELSIIISTYKNVEFLEECFSSIINSIKEQNVEVIIGIDACLETYEYVKKNKFPPYFRFVFFEENQGPYIIFNSLSLESNSKTLLFFGSDDIMCENMINDIITESKTHKIVKPSYIDFENGEEINLKSKLIQSEGVFSIDKDLFLSLNGFEPWLCAADSDLSIRLLKSNQKFKFTNKLSFFRRVHPKGLTSNLDTGGFSPIRKRYVDMINKKKDETILEKLHIHPFISTNDVDINKVQSVNKLLRNKTNKRNFINKFIFKKWN
jgi:glycosyltransferase involved in cell wall biosynthesis